jgi:hypothetical protein
MAKSPIHNPIAKEELLWVRKDGSEVAVVAQIGMPYQVDEYSWACPAELYGVESQYPDMHGASSMQALNLAIRLIRTRLGHLLEDNETLFYPSDKEVKLDTGFLDNVFGYAPATNSPMDPDASLRSS